jgi:hypothetical protein
VARVKIKTAHDPALRQAARAVQVLKLALAEIAQATSRTALVETKEEGHALRQALLAHTRDPERGLERFRFQERTLWRHVRVVLARAAAQNGASGAEEEE